MRPLLTSLLSLATAHPSVDGHLHEIEVHCTDPDGHPAADPMRGTVAAIRRAGVLTDAGRTQEALAELDRACLPDAEVTRLARARTLLRADRPAEALVAVEGLSGADASLWRAQALVALGREAEAGALLAAALTSLPAAPPDAYLDAARLVGPCAAAEILDLGVQRRGDVASLRRAGATAAWSCGAEADPLARLHPDDPRDQLLRGDLLASAGRHTEARQSWESALRQLDAQRDTPARARLRASILQRQQPPQEDR